jgi:hypothetical protein
LQGDETIRLGFNNDVHEQTKQISTPNIDTQPTKFLARRQLSPHRDTEISRASRDLKLAGVRQAAAHGWRPASGVPSTRP